MLRKKVLCRIYVIILKKNSGLEDSDNLRLSRSEWIMNSLYTKSKVSTPGAATLRREITDFDLRLFQSGQLCCFLADHCRFSSVLDE